MPAAISRPESSVNTVANLVEAPVPRHRPPTDEWVRRVFASCRPPFVERRAIGSPNPHAVLPTPARDAVAAILRDLSGDLALLGVTAIGLFGSVARGNDTPGSDVDIAAQFAGLDFATHGAVVELLERHFNRHVDVTWLPIRHPLSTLVGGDLIMV